MKDLLIILDGVNNRDYNFLPSVLNNFSLSYNLKTTPDGMKTDSLICTCSILGIPPEAIPTDGRAYVELLSQGKDLDDNDIIFRCNHIYIEDNILIGQNPTEPFLPKSDDYELIHLSSYKNLLIVKGKEKYFHSIQTFQPHEEIGRNLNSIMPISSNIKLNLFLSNLTKEYNLFPWGVSRKQYLPSFHSMYNKSCSMISGTETIRGIANCMDIHTPFIDDATSDIDTNLANKLKYTISSMAENDVTILHINGIDESKHRLNKNQVEKFLNRIEMELLQPLLASKELKNIAKNNGGLTITVMSDHESDVSTGLHLNSRVNVYKKIL